MFDFFRNTLTGWQWLVLGLVPPAIIALYFLKLKRQPLEVPSTYLWKRSIEDLHVNSLWQRLRQSLLLFLQLLLVALAMLALLRPGWEGVKLEGQRFIFLIDNSASMSAADVPDARSRLEEAKRLAAGLIERMDSGATAMIISFADTPQVVQEFTDNHRLLAERLATIQPTVRGTDLFGALKLADGLANPTRVSLSDSGPDVEIAKPLDADVYIFSDGRFEDVKGFALGNLRPIYVPIGSLTADNVAITAFTTRRSDVQLDQRQAFVQVGNFTDADKTVVVEILHSGQFLDARDVAVPAGEINGVAFPLADAPAGALTARLKYSLDAPGGRDALQQDDTAYAVLNEAAPGRVLAVTPGSHAVLNYALTTERATRLANVEFKSPDFLTSETYERAADTGEFDLVIYDRCVPARMPRANTLFIGRLPPLAAWGGREAAGGKDDATAVAPAVPQSAQPNDAEANVVSAPQIIDWDRAHPLLAYVELGNVFIADSLLLSAPVGGNVLIDSTAGTLAASAPRDAYQDVVLGFEIRGRDAEGNEAYNTDWPKWHSFPTFWLNVLEYLAGGTEDSQLTSVPPGRPVALRSAGNAPELTVVDPADERFTLRRSGVDAFQFHDTQRLGVYEVRRHDDVVERFAVNLFDRQESDVRLRPSQDGEGMTATPADIRIGFVDVAATVEDQAPARKELWKYVLAGALVVLVVEWYIYNRRVYL